MELNLKKSRSSRTEILSYLHDTQQNILKKACLIEKESSSSGQNEDHDSFDFAATSTPNPKKNIPKKKRAVTEREEDLVNSRNIQNIDNDILSISKAVAMVNMKIKEENNANCKAAQLAEEQRLRDEVAKSQAQRQAASQAKALKVQEEELQMLKEEEARAAERKQRQELQQQKYAQRVSMQDEQIKAAELQKKEAEVERKKKDAARLKCTMEIQQYIKQSSEDYAKIFHEFMACKALAPLLTELKSLYEGIQAIVQRQKSSNVHEKDLNAAKAISAKMNAIYVNVQNELAKMKKQTEERDALKQQEVIQHPIPVNQVPVPDLGTVSSEAVKDSSSVNELSDCADKDSLRWYGNLKAYKLNNEKLFDQLLKDDNLKKYRFDCQKAVNIPVNAISPVSATHLRDKLQKLTLLLSGQPVLIGDGVRVSAAQHPAGVPFCKDLLAKKFVRQGASTVSSKPEAAFAIAAVMVALWQEFPDWGQLLLAHFHHECPYLVPVFWPQLEGQSNKDYYQSLGYTYNDDGEVEKQDKFLKRMSGIMRLYAALLISRPPRERQSRPHPHDLGQGWRWLTCLLNLEPRPDICASLLYDFLEVTGSSMLEQYGRQFQKLLHVICKGYFPCLRKSAVSSSGPVVRLETFLQTILKQGSKPPQGMLPLNFW